MSAAIPANAAAPAAGGIEWLDEVGYSDNVLSRPDVLKLAVQDPQGLWVHLHPSFQSYQPFQGLAVKNKTGALQKVEDLFAEVVYMYMQEPHTAAQYPPPSSRTAKSATSTGGIFGFGSSSSSPPPPTPQASESADGNGSGALFVSTSSHDATAPITIEPATPAAAAPAGPPSSSAASTLSASIPSLKHPMNWHSYPYLHILLVSPPTLDEYVKTTKPQIKRFLEYFAAPNTIPATASGLSTPTPSSSSGGGGGFGATTPSSSFVQGGSGVLAATPSSAGMVVAGSSLVPELRYHSEVLIIYLPLLDSVSDFSSAASAATPSGGGGLASLFKRSTSLTPSSGAAAQAQRAEEQQTALKHARKVYDRLRADFAGRDKDPANSQVARVDLHEILRNAEREQAQQQLAAAGINAAAASAAATAVAAAQPLLEPGELVHQFDELVARIVRCLIRTHESRAALYELELRKSLAQSQLMGPSNGIGGGGGGGGSNASVDPPQGPLWNFCNFFVLKESYAILHQQMGLRIDALRLYDELKAAMDDMLFKGDSSQNALRYLLVSTRSNAKLAAKKKQLAAALPATAVPAAEADPLSLAASPMPAPLFDVFSRPYPLLILRGEVTELEFMRYLAAQTMWILFKISKTPGAANTASASATAAAASAGTAAAPASSGASSAAAGAAAAPPNYLLDVMRRGSELVLSVLSLIASDPVRFPIAAEAQLTWALEAAMDLGTVCEKHLVHAYIAAYQSLTSRIVQQQIQQQQQSSKDTSASRDSSAKQASSGASGGGGGGGFSNVLASAVANFIGPGSSSASSTSPNASGAPVPSSSSTSEKTSSSSTSSAAATASSLQSQTRALKAAHEADLKLLQSLRADLYGAVLERVFQWGRKHPVLKLQGEVRDVLRAEARGARQKRVEGSEGSASTATTDSTMPKPESTTSPNGSGGGGGVHANSAGHARLGLDDDVYADMGELYYPHEHEHSVAPPPPPRIANPSSLTKQPTGSAMLHPATMADGSPLYQLFEARHRRILSCFQAASQPGGLCSSSSNDTAAAVANSSASNNGSGGNLIGDASFAALFLELCTCCLKMYWLSARYRVCTRVAEMRACVLYSCGDWSRALELFAANCDRWRRDKWTQLFYPAAILTIKAQQKMGRHEEVVRACLLYLATLQQHLSSTRFRPQPTRRKLPASASADQVELQFSWSRIGGLITQRKLEQQQQHSSQPQPSNMLPPSSVHPEQPLCEGTDAAPLVPYSFPMLQGCSDADLLPHSSTSSSTTSSSSGSSSSSAPSSSKVPAVIQVLQLAAEDSEGAPQAGVYPVKQDEAKRQVPAAAAFLFDCCPHLVTCVPGPAAGGEGADTSDQHDAELDASIISPAWIQQLLVHTLTHHLGAVVPQGSPLLLQADASASTSQTAQWQRSQALQGMFSALRALAHRSPNLSCIFPSHPPHTSVAEKSHPLASPPPASSGRSRKSSVSFSHRGSVSSSASSPLTPTTASASSAVSTPVAITLPSRARVEAQQLLDMQQQRARSASSAASGVAGDEEAAIHVIAEEEGGSDSASAASQSLPPSSARPSLAASPSTTRSPSPSSFAASLAPAAAATLPPGGYVEGSLHPLFALRKPSLFLYRKTHPLHAVLELEVDCRLPEAITLDALGVVIALQRLGADGELHATATAEPLHASTSTVTPRVQRKQVSVMITPPTPVRSHKDGAGLLPSPLPSQSSSTTTLDDLTSLQRLRPSDEPSSATAGVAPSPSPSLPQPSASPEPPPSKPSPPTVATNASPRSSGSSSRPDEPEEWSCIFERVTLQPGTNKLFLHVFHTALVPATSDDGKPADAADVKAKAAAEAQQQAAAAGEHSGSLEGKVSVSQHCLVLYHSVARLEHVHALFEASHAHMQQVVEQRQRRASMGARERTTSITPLPSARNQNSNDGAPFSSTAAPASHVHSFSSTRLSLRDVWFGLGRLQLWALDVEALNAALHAQVLTVKQRRAQRAKQARKAAARVSPSHRPNSDINGLAALKGGSDDFMDVSLDAISSAPNAVGIDEHDPHFQLGCFVPPVALVRPFAGKPRLGIELLPIAPASLLLGKTAPFQLGVSIIVGGGGGNEPSAASASVDKCVLRVATEGGLLRLFASTEAHNLASTRAHSRRSSSADLAPGTAASAAVEPAHVVYGLLQHEGRSEQRTFPLNLRSGDVVLGTLPAGCTLLLLIPVYAPGHLAHLLRTKQIALPASSVSSSPHTSLPTSPQMTSYKRGAGSRKGSIHLPPTAASTASSLEDSLPFDLHSETHSLSMDLTCSSGSAAAASSVPAAMPQQQHPSFMFSSYSALTFMEPLQMKASMERLGQRWFLQLFLWNRCAYPLQLRSYALELPRGFVLKADPNQLVAGYVIPAVTTADAPGHTMQQQQPVAASALPGAAAAALASSVPVSYSSPNVYSLVFELAVDHRAPSSTSADGGKSTPLLQVPDEDVDLAHSFTSSSHTGRFQLSVDTAPQPHSVVASPAHSAAAPRPATALSLSWPIDIAIMSGAQDLHLVLSFPQQAYMGRMLTLTLTVLHMCGANKRQRGVAAAGSSSRASGGSSSSAAAAPLSLLYSVQCQSHLWLLCGKQSGAFVLGEGEQQSFALRILPVASGYLPIPHVEIMQQQQPQSQAEHNNAGPPVLQQAAEKLSQMQSAESGELRVRTNEEGLASASVAPAAASTAGTGARHYAPIPPARILRHFATNHQIHVYPPTAFATQLAPMASAAPAQQQQ